jgi:hypothetical protein
LVTPAADNTLLGTFRRVAVDGGWTIATQAPAPRNPDNVSTYFEVGARERGDRGHSCSIYGPSSPILGAATCESRLIDIALLYREQEDGSMLLRSRLFVRPDSRWHLTLTASGVASQQVVEFDDWAGSQGGLRSQVVITGVEKSPATPSGYQQGQRPVLNRTRLSGYQRFATAKRRADRP